MTFRSPARRRERIDGVERFWKAVTDSLPAHIAVLDLHGQIVAINASWKQFGLTNGGGEFGSDWNYLSVCDAAAAAGDESAAAAAASIRDVLEGRRDTVLEVYPCHGPEEERWFLMRVARLAAAVGAGVVVQHHDVTRQHLADAQLRLRARLLDEVGSSVVAVDRHRRVIFWNDAATDLYGWSGEEVCGKPIPEGMRFDPDYVRQFERLGADEVWEGIVTLRPKDGVARPIQTRIVVARDEAGEIEWTVGVSSDASERVEREAGLRSSRDFQRALAESIPDGVVALGNDGNVLYLNPAAERMLGWESSELEGKRMDEFTHPVAAAGILPDFDGSAMALALQLNPVVEVPLDEFIRADGTSFPVAYKASSFAAPGGVDGTVLVFRDISDERAAEEQQRRELRGFSDASRIRDAIDNDELVLYAQPIVETRTRRVIRHELLLRMKHAGRIIMPGDFLPAAHQHNLMIDIDRWVIRHALLIAAEGHSISFNLAAESLGRPDLAAYIEAQLLATGADATRVVVEVTETGVVENEAMAAATLERIAALGCRIALDDFGTGYGGFTYLKRLPVEILKIDREFLLEPSAKNQAVIQAIVNLARAFGQEAVAEGVETQEALELLSRLGVPYAQGYLFGHPVELDEALGPASTLNERTASDSAVRS